MRLKEALKVCSFKGLRGRDNGQPIGSRPRGAWDLPVQLAELVGIVLGEN